MHIATELKLQLLELNREVRARLFYGEVQKKMIVDPF